MENTIGIHYQTFKNRIAVTQVIESFRQYYPDAPMRMVSDGGEDFTDLAEKYNCIFDYENENIYPKAIFVGNISPNHTLPIWDASEICYGAKVWLRRLYDTCKKLNTDWIILFEDDVATIKDSIMEFPKTDAASADCASYSPALKQYLENNPNVKKEYCWDGYGLVGGSIINRKFMIDAYEKNINNIDFKSLAILDYRISGWSDILLNIFVSVCGGTYSSNWAGIGGDLRIHPNATFLHGAKDLYQEYQGSYFATEDKEQSYLKDTEWCFQFFNNEPVVFAYSMKYEKEPRPLVIELQPHSAENIVFENNGMKFKIFPREITEKTKKLRKEQDGSKN